MKVALDLSKLLAEGKITREEHDKLLQFGKVGTTSLAFNILIAFGVVAVAAGVIALVPNPSVGVAIGGLILAAGLGISLGKLTQWDVLGNIFILVGALILGGGVVVLTDASIMGFLVIAAGFAVAGVLAQSGLLVGLSVMALASSLGSRTGYMHASYFLGIEQPAATVLLFSALAVGGYLLSKKLPHVYERLAIIVARVSVLLVNFGFWIGSLWGSETLGTDFVINDLTFTIGWVVVLVGSIIWAVWANRQWVVNVMAVFAAIHFYTQWFERLGPEPVAILLAGILALGFAIGLWQFNKIWNAKLAEAKA
jgi:iron complex transport system permease protein